MTVPEITIGLPVHNGADLIGESLDCLAAQTFRDFKVLVLDNASTDETPAIIASFVQRDPRFVHVRREQKVSTLENFLAAMNAAESPWFLWRADDDLCDANYLEALHGLALRSPGCRLAVSTIVTQDLDGGRRKVTAPPKGDPATLAGRLNMLLSCHPSWFYGLWDLQTIRRIYPDICEHFPFAFAADHLTLYGPIVAGAVYATPETHFVQRTRRTASAPRRQTRTPLALMVETRREFRRELRRIRSQWPLTPMQKAALIVAEPLYLHHTLPSLLKMARTAFKETFGLVRTQATGRHFDRRL